LSDIEFIQRWRIDDINYHKKKKPFEGLSNGFL
jgi:hypothetical protein